MRLPSSLVGKNGNCPACKKTVLISNPQGSIDQGISPDIASSLATPNTSEASVKQPSSPAEQIRNRLLLLKQGKHEFANAEMLKSQAVESLNQSREEISRLFSAIGSQVAMAYTLGEIKETPSLMNLIAVNRQLMDVQNESAMLTPGPNAGIVEKTKAKAKQVALGGKIKTLEGQIENQQFELGKEIYESRNWDVYTSNTTSEIFQELNSLEQNIANAQNRLDQASSAFEDLKISLSNSIPLNAIQDISTFEVAIGLSERQLAELEGTPLTSNINQPVQSDPQRDSKVTSASPARKKSLPIKSIAGLTFVSIIAAGLYFVFTSNLLSLNPDIDNYGQEVLEAFKNGSIHEFAATYPSYEEAVALAEDYKALGGYMPEPIPDRDSYQPMPDYKRTSSNFIRAAAGIPKNAIYLVTSPGRIITNQELESLEKSGIEQFTAGTIYAYDDSKLYRIGLDNCTKTNRGWFTGGEYFRSEAALIDEDYKARWREILMKFELELEAGKEQHPLTIEAMRKVSNFVIDF